MSTQIIESRPAGYGKEQVVDPRRWFALPVLLTGACLPILDFNVVNLALPAIRGDLGSTSSEVQFVISAYAATCAVFPIAGGWLGDLFGRRRMFLWGVAGFTPGIARQVWVCAVIRRRFPVGVNPTRQPLEQVDRW